MVHFLTYRGVDDEGVAGDAGDGVADFVEGADPEPVHNTAQDTVPKKMLLQTYGCHAGNTHSMERVRSPSVLVTVTQLPVGRSYISTV